MALLCAAWACNPVHAAKPAAVSSYPPDWPHKVPFKLNRELLLPETERIVFIVDAPRGSPPIVDALNHLATLAQKYGERPASWVRLGESGSPQLNWVVPSESSKARHDVGGDDQPSRDDLDTERLLSEVPACPNGSLPANVSYVFIRYVGKIDRGFGSTVTVDSDRSCEARRFSVIRVAQTRIAEKRAPGLGQSFLERHLLSHEYGHVLGLGSNPAHGHWIYMVPYRREAHCVHRDCAVAAPTAMAFLRGQMLDYCAACVRDIEDAREYWRSGKEFSEVPRLAQPDPAADVARLKNYNFCDGCEADKLIGHGKAVMPSLIARLQELPGGSAASPRSYAARLALKIVIAEYERTQPRGSPIPAVPESLSDGSPALLAWWQEESERFMGGDDWSLPLMLRSSGLFPQKP
jgi:hypothetical protein